MASFIANLLATIILTFFCDIRLSLAKTCHFNVKLNQALLGEGFHRNLTFGIVFDPQTEAERWLYHDCIVGVDQPLPSGVFANPDELGDLRRARKLNAIPKTRINIELPAEDSQPSGVYVIGEVIQDKAYMWLPVHARYHRAKVGGGPVTNYILRPKLYLRCPDDRLDHCDKNSAPIMFLCNGSSKEKCSWKEISFGLMSDTIKWSIPVGDIEHYYVVASFTGFLIIIASLYLLKTIHDYKRAERKKKH